MFPFLISMLSTTALAESGPYMWGVGPTLSTIIVPAGYPASFPADVREDFKDFEVRGDIGIGGRGTMYLDKGGRLFARAGTQLGPGFRALDFMGGYDAVMQDSNKLGLFVGGAAGFGNQRFISSTDKPLTGNSYVLRAEAGSLYRNRTQAYEITAYLNLIIPTIQEYDGAQVNWGFYTYIGLEGTFYFGDFTPPKSSKGGGHKGKGK